VSLVISSALLALVSTVFLVQTDFYGTQLQRATAQDNARSVTEIVATELRTVMGGGIEIASDTQLVVRSPIVLAVVCALQGNRVHVHMEGGKDAVDKDEVGGIAVYNDTTSTWSYYTATWGYIKAGHNGSADRCASQAADTAGGADDFMRLRRLKSLHGSVPPIGTLLMLYRETEFLLTESVLNPGSVSLYRTAYGETPEEFASGMDTTAQFMYRTGGTGYANSVPPAGLSLIDAVRLVATTRVRAQSGGRDDITAGWTVDVPLRNVN